MIERDSKAKRRKQAILDVIQMVFCFVYLILPFTLRYELDPFTLKAVSNLKSIHTDFIVQFQLYEYFYCLSTNVLSIQITIITIKCYMFCFIVTYQYKLLLQFPHPLTCIRKCWPKLLLAMTSEFIC